MSAPALASPPADDPPRLRLRAAPVLEPRPALRVPTEVEFHEAWPDQQALPLDAPDVAAGPRTDAGGTAGHGERPADGGRGRCESAAADIREWAARFAQAALEVSVGLRPAAQLLRWASDDVLLVLARRHALTQRAGGTPRRAVVRSVHLCLPVRGVVEAAVVVGDGVRVKALAFRMEAFERRWRVTSIEIG